MNDENPSTSADALDDILLLCDTEFTVEIYEVA